MEYQSVNRVPVVSLVPINYQKALISCMYGWLYAEWFGGGAWPVPVAIDCKLTLS